MSVGRVGWTFLTHHGHVLVCLANDPRVRLRDVAERVGITERAAQGILADLVAEGYVERERIGRRNRYRLNGQVRMRHPIESDHEVGELLKIFQSIGG